MKPILFNTEMVKAILDGHKNVTRRVVKQKGWEITGRPKWGKDQCVDGRLWFTVANNTTAATATLIEPPYRPGDTLYVRETWRMMWNGTYRYKADPGEPEFGWRPSIHMPNEAARLFLRVTNARVERLQNISEEDAMLEGIERRSVPVINASNVFDYYIPGTKRVRISARGAFANFWDSTIRKTDLPRYGWDASPWVWVIGFERCEKPKEET